MASSSREDIVNTKKMSIENNLFYFIKLTRRFIAENDVETGFTMEIDIDDSSWR